MDHNRWTEQIINKTFKDLSKASGVDLSEANVNSKNSLAILALETLEVVLEQNPDNAIKATTIGDIETTLEASLEIQNCSEEEIREKIREKVLSLLRKYIP